MQIGILRRIDFILLSFLLSCSSVEQSERAPLPIPVQRDSYWDDVAKILAGLEIESEKKSYIHLTDSSNYKAYSRRIDSYWKKAETNYFKEIRQFRDENINNLTPTNTALYPLSGADFINLYHFNSDSPRFIMIGLQDPGKIADFHSLKSDEFKTAFRNLESLVYELTYLNYYTSKRLDRDSKNRFISGVGPVILIFLKRFGFYISEFTEIHMDSEGMIQSGSAGNTPGKNHPGIRIRFYREGDQFLRELFFFKIFLNYESGTQLTPEGKFFSRQNRFNLMFKSAEYIMQMEEYRPFLNTILEKTDRVIEDESGAPIKAFRRDQWDIKVFGKYIGRIPLKNTPDVPFQDELKELFETQKPPKLGFPFGYGVLKGKEKSNLIYIHRK